MRTHGTERMAMDEAAPEQRAAMVALERSIALDPAVRELVRVRASHRGRRRAGRRVGGRRRGVPRAGAGAARVGVTAINAWNRVAVATGAAA